ncbi:DUF3185 family protein [Colwelliaceae bacterium BS250]
MATNKIISLILLIIGAALAYWGYQSSQEVGAQFSQSITGSFSDEVLASYIGSTACFVGAYVFKKK